MNILIMSKIFANSGVGSHIMDLSENLVERGHTVYLMSGTNDHEEFCCEKKINFTYIDFSMTPLNIIKNIDIICKFIKKHRIDIVHCHHRSCAFYMNILSRFTGVPYVWSNHLDNIPSDFIIEKQHFMANKQYAFPQI
ncbi:glycosyltransferase [Lacrimispora sp. 210928-DFI.3.58]|uniref:glycosyltransferase n=1 Tax=Lacrimispora sp. 210928-DFI.3.58 TaxID=2883214 RepID=UPI001D05F2BD|nr:glycosyltransferase [Lacrimispora sp. 210928-DFI.3.58]MCB7320093.1 glycosyltransferase [Lacrimispora sp. 210928-DFI.3.58]